MFDPTPKLDDTLGALLLGGLFAMALWGTACIQSYTYFMHHFKDPRYMKLMVAFLWFLDTFDSALDIHILYTYMVKLVSDLTLTWSIKIHVATTALSSFLIRTMFIHKVFFLSDRNIWLTAWLMATSLGDLVVGLVITIKAFGINSFAEVNIMSHLFYITFALGTASDISLAVALCLFLRRSRTGFQETDSMISTLMTYAVNTCMVVALDASLGMITFIVMPNNLIFLAFYLLLNKFYLNAYLAALNTRARFRKEDTASIHISQISDCQYAPNVDQESILDISMSVPIATEHLHNRTVDGPSESSSTIAYRDGLPCAV